MELKDKDEINKILSALGEQMVLIKCEPMDLLVCGGSALNVLNLVSRTTKDVDVVAKIIHKENIVLVRPDPFPEELEKAIGKVARDFALTDNWFNAGPASALDFGLPEGVINRAETHEYGTLLTVRFFSRYDQIHFKLYAAVDQGGKHYEDLLALKPRAEELFDAAVWSMTHDVSEPYRDEVKKLLIGMGYKNVAERI